MADAKIKTAVIATAARRAAIRAQTVNKPKTPKVEGEEPKHKLTPELQANVEIAKAGGLRPKYGTPPGKRLLTRIKEVLGERSLREDPETGAMSKNTRFDDAADAFVQQMEGGNFQFFKEYIEREEGKVAEKIHLTDEAVKLYEDVPVDGPEAP